MLTANTVRFLNAEGVVIYQLRYRYLRDIWIASVHTIPEAVRPDRSDLFINFVGNQLT